MKQKKIESSGNLNKHIGFRATEEEKKILERRKNKHNVDSDENLSLSQFIRTKIIKPFMAQKIA